MNTTMTERTDERTEEKKKASDLDIVYSVLAYLVRDSTIARCENIKGQLQRVFGAHKDHSLIKDTFYFRPLPFGDYSGRLDDIVRGLRILGAYEVVGRNMDALIHPEIYDHAKEKVFPHMGLDKDGHKFLEDLSKEIEIKERYRKVS